MNIDELLEQNVKNSLNTCLDINQITVSEDLIKRTMAKINEAKEKEQKTEESVAQNIEQTTDTNKDNITKDSRNKEDVKKDIITHNDNKNEIEKKDAKCQETNELAATIETLQSQTAQNVLPLDEQRMRKEKRLHRLRVVTNVAAALLILFVGVGVLDFFGGGFGSKSCDSQNNMMFTPSNEKFSSSEESYTPGYEYGDTASDGVQNSVPKDQDVSDKFQEESVNEMAPSENTEIETANGSVQYTSEYPYSFEEICGFDVDSTNEIVIRDVINQTMKEISDARKINELFRMMNEIAYGDMQTEPTDPNGWDYVLEITLDDESTLQVYLGDYLVIMENREIAKCYVASDTTYLDKLSSFEE